MCYFSIETVGVFLSDPSWVDGPDKKTPTIPIVKIGNMNIREYYKTNLLFKSTR